MSDGSLGPESSDGAVDFFAREVGDTLAGIESGEVSIDFDTLHERATSMGLDVARTTTIVDRSDVSTRDDVLRFDTGIGDEDVVGYTVRGHLFVASRNGERPTTNLVFSFTDLRNGVRLSFNNKGVVAKGPSFGSTAYPDPSRMHSEDTEAAIAETMLDAGNVFNQLFGDRVDI